MSAEECAWPDCHACEKERWIVESELGLRCRTCLTSFDKPYRVEGDVKGYCRGCGSVVHTRRPRAGSYGTAGPARG